MKKNTSSTIYLVLQRIVFCVALLAVWYWWFPHTLLHFEETDFWTDASDTTHIIWQWPHDWAAIWAAYLMQFFQYKFWGTVLLVLMPLLTLLATDVVLWRLFRCRQLLWLSFVPALLVALSQSVHVTLEPSLRVAVLSWLVALVVVLATLRGPLWRVRWQSRWQRVLAAVLPWAGIALLVLLLTTDRERQQAEQTLYIEHLAAEGRWGELLDATYSRCEELDDNQMSYSLLALSQEGQLADRLFCYPVRGLENVFTHSENYRFNSFFAHELGLPNEAIRYAFEEGQYMPAGASFGTMRRMVDWLIEKGDDPQLADFYLNLLSHSSCHRDFVATRRIFMGQTPRHQRDHRPEFVGSPSFLHEAAVVLDRDPANAHARDYLLCGLLLLGNTEAFFELFERIYVQMDDAPIPTHYQEALLALRGQHPEIGVRYPISERVERRYSDFCRLLRTKTTGRQAATEQYKQTYWGYLLRREEAAKGAATDAQTGASLLIGPEFGN